MVRVIYHLYLDGIIWLCYWIEIRTQYESYCARATFYIRNFHIAKEDIEWIKMEIYKNYWANARIGGVLNIEFLSNIVDQTHTIQGV